MTPLIDIISDEQIEAWRKAPTGKGPDKVTWERTSIDGKLIDSCGCVDMELKPQTILTPKSKGGSITNISSITMQFNYAEWQAFKAYGDALFKANQP